jgi:LuxR family transcriptional regulator, maltose regulon positive regulatory protein
MATTVLLTKLYVPPPRPRAIARPRLVERLNEGLHHKLALISAPAGFGKTTLVSEWVAGCGRPVAWLSLDEADNDLVRFLEYLVAAVQTVAPDLGAGLLGALRAPQPPPIESFLTALVNEITMLRDEVVLVLDDYHVIDAKPIDEALAFLIEHLPPPMHLVITTREDPQLPLARLRARGHLAELRAADLRFIASEAAEFLNPVMGLNLSAADVAALEDRTEGWIAGLQLAAISMQGHRDAAGFIQSFTGSHRFVMDYLVDEVLHQQPAYIQAFLLRTSILDRLCGSLCDAVLPDLQEPGQAVLEHIERANLFLIPLDDERRWYRYHHLFAELLRQRLEHGAVETAGEVASLHGRASGWYEQNSLRPDAIRHALAAGDPERAAGLIELSAVGMLGSNQEEMLYGWLTALPDDVVRARPVLSVNYAFAAFSREGLDAADARLRDAERWFDPSGHARDELAGEMRVTDVEGFQSLPGTIAVARAYRAGALGDAAGIVTHARRALEHLPGDSLWRGAAAAVLGIGYWISGELEPAFESFAEGKALMEMAGYTQFQNSGVHILADIRIAQGRLNEAQRIYEQALRLAAEQPDVIWGKADLHVGLAELDYERNDLESAIGRLGQSKELGEHAGMPDTRHRWYVTMARIRQAQGDKAGALELLDEAERQYVIGPDPDVRPITALKTQVWIAQGRLADALGWVRERNLSLDDEPAYLHEAEHLTLARVLIAQYANDPSDRSSIAAVLACLERLLDAAETGERTGSVIEILMLQALAHAVDGDGAAALGSLQRALVLAKPEGYVRVFVNEGPPMAQLLAEAAAHGILPDYTGRLLAAFEPEPHERQVIPGPPAVQPLNEPLSPRELEVLRLIGEGRSNREIGDQLYLALDTVKGHNRKIFGKLDVRSRTEAIARARELGIL